jgi:cell division protease FtsH
VDGEVRRILDECYNEPVRLLQAHRQELEVLAKALPDRETLDEQEILNVTGLPRAPRPETVPMPAGRDGSADGLPPGAHPS